MAIAEALLGISSRGVVLYFKVTKVFGPGDGEEEQTGLYLADKHHTSLYTVKPQVLLFQIKTSAITLLNSTALK